MSVMGSGNGINARRLNCPNCGAPIEGQRCAYCGTVFYDFSCIDVSSPCVIRLRTGDRIFEALMSVRDLDFNVHDDWACVRNILGEITGVMTSQTQATIDLRLATIGDFKMYKEEIIHERSSIQQIGTGD